MTVNFQQIPYGGTYLGYAFGKDGVELVYSKGIRFDNKISASVTDEGVLDQIKLFQTSMGKHPKNAIYCAEISPSPEESKDWSNQDFRNIAIELLSEMDNIELKDKRVKLLTKKTTLMNSMCAIVKHIDSASGIIHLHAMISTIDLDGNAIPQHKIAERAIAACDIINARHRWKQPKEIRAEHLEEINSRIDNELRSMRSWNWDYFASRMEFHGYFLKEKRDNTGKLVNYTLYRGNSKFKASELGKDNCYTAAHIENTWMKLHQPMTIEKPTASYAGQQTFNEEYVPNCICESQTGYSISSSNSNSAMHINGLKTPLIIPKDIFELFEKECTIPEDNSTAKQDDVIKVAVMLFLGYIDAATTYVESHGGGNSPTSDWGRKKDEDDWMFAHRCAKLAHTSLKPRVHYGRKR